MTWPWKRENSSFRPGGGWIGNHSAPAVGEMILQAEGLLEPFLPEGPGRRDVGFRQRLQELLAGPAETEVDRRQRFPQAALVAVGQAQRGQGFGHQPDGDRQELTLKRLIFFVVVISMAWSTMLRRWIFW
jgi:hypothetical protein